MACLLIGCDSDPPPPPFATPAPRASSSTVAPNPGDQERAEAALLQLADLPPGYIQSELTPVPESPADDASLAECLGRPPTASLETARAFAPNFTVGDTREISSSVTFVASEGDARADMDAYRQPGAVVCLRQLFEQQLGRAVPGNPRVGVEPLSPVPGGPEGAAFRIAVTISVEGQDVTQFIDLVVAVSGRAEVTATFRDVNVFVEPELEDDVVETILGRL